MDIELFSRIVKDLLASKEKACVPDFGTFVVVEVPATFSDKGFTINPPYYRVDFIPSVEDDGEFIRLYSSSNNVDGRKAEKLLRQFLACFKNELFDRKVVALPGLGRLKVAAGNFLLFVQDENLNILPEFDCLQPVSLKSLMSEAGTTVARAEDVPDEPLPLMKKKPAWRIALTVLLITLAVALAALALAGRLCPQLVDPLLYSPEQLEILNAGL